MARLERMNYSFDGVMECTDITRELDILRRSVPHEKNNARKEAADTHLTFKPGEFSALMKGIRSEFAPVIPPAVSDIIFKNMDVASMYPTFAPYCFIPTDIVDEVHREIINYITNDIYSTKEVYETMRNSIKKVIFNNPATIIIWGDGDKTIVKCGEGEVYDPEKGLAMAIAKRFLGDKGNYYETFKKWLPKEDKADKKTAKEPDTKKLMTISEFCKEYNVTKSAAYRMIKRGVIYAVKNDKGHWMVDPETGGDKCL